MRALWDGFLSALVALATLFICGVPAWFTFGAIQSGAAPSWVYAPLAGLIAIAALLTWAFARKAIKGISPSRMRRR